MPEYEGLMINPCIPENWSGFKVVRNFRENIYYIEVKNPHNVSKGIKSITVDDVKINGNILPVFENGSEHKVEVVMG